MYFIVGASLIIIGIISQLKQFRRFFPMPFLFYGVTMLLIEVMLSANMRVLHVVRYYFYTMSALFVAIVPFLLGVLALLNLMKMNVHQQRRKWWRIAYHVFISFTFLTFVAHTLMSVLGVMPTEYNRFLSIYIEFGLYFLSMMITYLLFNFAIHYWPKKQHYTHIIVLGSEIGDEGEILNILKRRLDTAYQYYLQQPMYIQARMTFVLTGGMKYSGTVSEAETMREYLVQRGIPRYQIQCEKFSRNTFENFIYSKRYLPKQVFTQPLLVITSKFHLVRACHLSQLTGYRAKFKGARVPFYLWPYSFVREYLAFLVMTKEMNYVMIIVILFIGLIQLANM